MAAAWPERAGDPFADQMNALRKYVASRTLTPDDLTWGTRVASPGRRGRPTSRGCAATDGGDLAVMGSASLVRTLLAEGLVDELRLMIEPILLGGGKTDLPGGRRGAADAARHVASPPARAC